jgi:hypothetical protein
MMPYTIFGIVAAIAGGLMAKFNKFDFSACSFKTLESLQQAPR